MIKILITVIFIYFLSIMIFRMIILLVGYFAARAIKTKFNSSAKQKSSAHKKYNSEDVIDVDFKEIKK